MPTAPVWISVALMGIVAYVLTVAWRTVLPVLFSDRRLMTARVAMLGWLAVVTALSMGGVLSDFSSMPPRFAIVVVPAILSVIVLGLRPSVRARLGAIDTPFVSYQTFRFPLELVLLALTLVGALPQHMSFEGRNVDIIMGLSAPLVAMFIRRGVMPRPLLIAWNVLGLALVVNVMMMGILSTPTPVRVFHDAPGTVIMTVFPYVFIPALLVPMALFGHILSLRQALSAK